MFVLFSIELVLGYIEIEDAFICFKFLVWQTKSSKLF